MTAQLTDFPRGASGSSRTAFRPQGPARRPPAPRPVRRPAAGPTRIRWASPGARSCAGVTAVPGDDASRRLYWTERGVAVLVTLVALVVAVMGVTLVAAFLAVSDEPLPATVARAA